MPGPYTLTLDPDKNGFSYPTGDPANPVAQLNPGQTTPELNACQFIAVIEAASAANPSVGGVRGVDMDAVRKECGPGGAPSVTPSPAPAVTPTETSPTGGDSANLQGAPNPPVVGALNQSPGPPADPVPPTQEPTRTPAGELTAVAGERPQKRTVAGDPVEIFSGALYLDETDLSIVNAATPLAFRRLYRSGAPCFGPLGWNWDHGFNSYLRVLASGDVAVWRELHEDLFLSTGAGFEPPRGVFELLVRPPGPDEVFEIQEEGGRVRRYTRPPGWLDAERIPLVAMADRHGNQLRFTYGDEDKLIDVRDDDDRGFTFTYDACGLLTAVTDHAGRRFAYEHDEETMQLVAVTSPPTANFPEGVCRQYDYEASWAAPDLRHGILRVTDGDGRVYLENEYQPDPTAWGYGRVVRQLVGGYLYQYTYSQLQWVPANAAFVNIPAARVEVLTPQLGLETYTFNYRGDLLDRRIRLTRDNSFRVLAWTYEMDTQGNLAVGTRPDGSQEIYSFDFENADPRMRGRLLRKELTAAAGFPAPSRIVWRGAYEPTYQLLTEETNERGATTRYRYDFDLTPGAASNTGKLLELVQPEATLPDGQTQIAISRYAYNARGQLVAAVMPDGRRNEIEYGTAGSERAAPVRWVDDVGGADLTRTAAYDAFGHARSMTDSAGHSDIRTYNALGQLERVELPAVATSAVIAATTYHYDADGFVIATERPAGAYNDPQLTSGRIRDEVQRDVLGYPVAHRQAVNTATPRTVQVCSDDRGRPVRTVNPDGSVLTRTYDERGLLIREVLQGPDGAAVSRRQTFDRAGNLIRAVDTHGGVTTYAYDGFSRMREVNLPNGATVRWTYHSGKLVASEEVVGDDGTGVRRTLSRTHWDYDRKGRKVREIIASFTDNVATAVELPSTVVYDEMDRVVSLENHRGGVWTRRYDGLGRLMEAADPLGNLERRTYDPVGNVIAEERHHREPDSSVSILRKAFAYDARNRRIREIEPDGSALQFEFDDRGLMVRRTDQIGQVVERGYDAFGNLTVDHRDPGGLGILTKCEYDAGSRLVRFVDPLGEVSTYAYDGIGRLVATIFPNGQAVRRSWNALDQVAREEMGSGAAFAYDYDAANRLARADDISTAPSLLALDTHEYTYDGLDRLIRATVDGGAILRRYDSLGRLVEESGLAGAMHCRYDDLAGRSERRWPDGRVETQSHDLNGILSQLEETSPGALGTGLAAIRYTPSGPNFFGATNYAGALSVSHRYDERKRVVGISVSRPQAAPVTFRYAYDAANRRRVEEYAGALSELWSHRFDARRRLVASREGAPIGFSPPITQADHEALLAAAEAATAASPHAETFAYDAADGRLTATESGQPARAYSYQPGHRIASDGLQTFAFGPDGTLQADGRFEYQADTRGRVRRILEAGVVVTAIDYDALGRPATILEDGSSETTLAYFGDQVVQEKQADAPTLQVTRHPLSGAPIARHSAGKTLYCLSDVRQNLRALVEADGTIVEQYRYKAFGTPAILDGAGQPRSQPAFGAMPSFGGLRFLQRSGKYLALRRMLDPEQGQFLSPDSKAYADSASLYVYVAQNPIDYTDVLGQQKTPPTERADRDVAANESDWRWYDNPVWNTVNHNGIGFAMTLFEEVPRHAGAFDRFIRPWARWAAFGKSGVTRFLGGKGWDALLKFEDLLNVPGAKAPGLFAKVPFASWLPMSRVNAVLGPLGVISNTMSLLDALESDKTIPEKVNDVAFNSAGIFSSAVGTTSLLGAGLSSLGFTGAGGLLARGAGFFGPAGLIAGAAAGGYAIGQFIDEKLGWHESLAARANRNRDIYSDMGLNDTASGILGGAAAIPVLSEVGQGLGWAAFKGYEGGKWVGGKAADGYDWVTDKAGYEFCVPFYSCD
jgi:RHS repeat-associated protein